MRLIDEGSAGTSYTDGKVYSQGEGAFVMMPMDIVEREPKIYTLARQIAKEFFCDRKFGGIQLGTYCQRTEEVAHGAQCTLVAWHRSQQIPTPSGT